MYSRCSFQTALSPQEALLRLSRVVGQPQSRWQAIEAGPARQQRQPFVGIIDGERFRIRRTIDYRNNFLPVISGRIEPDAAGSRIDIVVKLKPAIAAVMILWLSAMSFAAAQVCGSPYKRVRRKGWPGYCFPSSDSSSSPSPSSQRNAKR